MCSQICFDFLDINIEFTGGDGRLRRVSGGDVASAKCQEAMLPPLIVGRRCRLRIVSGGDVASSDCQEAMLPLHSVRRRCCR